MMGAYQRQLERLSVVIQTFCNKRVGAYMLLNTQQKLLPSSSTISIQGHSLTKMTNPNPETEPKPHSQLSLAELEAENNLHKQQFKIDDQRLQALQQIIDHFSTQLRDRDNLYQQSLQSLRTERHKVQSCEKQRTHLADQSQHLQKRCVQLENDLSSNDFVNKKIAQLNIAKNVIKEKDKMMKEMQHEIDACKQRANDADIGLVDKQKLVDVLEQHVSELKKQLSDTRQQYSTNQVLIHESQEKVSFLETTKRKTEEHAAAALTAANESEQKRRECQELLETTSRRYQVILAQKDAVLEESQQLKDSLATAEQEISRLTSLLQDRSGDYLGSTSPCSLVTDSDVIQPASQHSHVQSLAELEESCTVSSGAVCINSEERELPSTQQEANNEDFASSVRASRRCCEEKSEQLQEANATIVRQEETLKRVNAELTGSKEECELLTNQVQEHNATIVRHEETLKIVNTELAGSKEECELLTSQVQERKAAVVRQEETLKRINTELAASKLECELLTNRVHKQLTPALHTANDSLEEKEKQLTAVRDEFDLHREMAEKTRSALELEVGSATERLEDTLLTLQNTQDELSTSQQRVVDLHDQLGPLNQERSELQDKFELLEQDNEHRRQSLRVMQERLTTIELSVATHEQTVADTEEEKERLERLLSQEIDRRHVAENRATRKDELVLQLESRALELERNHAVLEENLAEKTERVSNIEKELNHTKEVAELRDKALQAQASMCGGREELFESLTGELKMVIQSRDSELRDTKHDLSKVERRIKSLSKCLEEERSKLKSRERELAENARKFDDSEAENRRKDSKLSEAEDQFSRVTAEYQAAQEGLDTRDKQIASHLMSISEKSGKIVALRTEKTELEKTVLELRNLLSEERSNLESQVATTTKLEEDLTAVRAKLATCEDDLSLRDAEVDSLGQSLETAQKEFSKLASAVGDKDDEISANANTISSLETALERSKDQLVVLESHLDGHDTLLKDNREKDESLAVKSGELNQARDLIAQMENDISLLRETVESKEEKADALSMQVVALEAAKAGVGEELEREKKARTSAEKSLNETSASLAALQNSTTEEIADLNATISSLKKVIEEKDSSLNSASETIAQSSVQSDLTKEQLIDSRTRGDRLFSRLTATEYELASKKESLATLEQRFSEIQATLKGREEELEKMGKTLVLRDQALSSARAKLDVRSKKASTIADSELQTMQTKLEAKEKAIANLHNWCCFINGKLHASEKSLAERDMDLEISSTAFKKLEAQLHDQNDLLVEKEAQMRKLESSRVVENSELRSRIHELQSYVDEAKAELERTKQMVSSKGSEAHASLFAVSEELVECKTKLKSTETEMSEVLSRKRNLEETVNTYERDLATCESRIECLTLELGRLQNESDNKRDTKDANDMNTAEEILNVRSEASYLVVELRRAEAELSAANEATKAWQKKAEELQPLAESTLEAQRAVEIVSSQLVLLQKDSKQRIDLLETQLKEAERERDAAERDCSAAIADYTAMRARLMKAHSRSSAFGRLAGANSLCTVAFVLEGRGAPSADIMVYILGDDVTLGQWNPSRRLPVRVIGEGENGVVRKCEVVLPANLSTAYKYAADGPDGGLVWEGENNRSLDLHGDTTFEVTDVWRPPS